MGVQVRDGVVGEINTTATGKLSFDTIRPVIKVSKGTTVNNVIVKPMISLSSDSEYEPYKEPITYTPNTDGTVEGITSLYPVTTLLTDTAGVIVDCEYNRDLNKAFEELTNAIISLGGNV